MAIPGGTTIGPVLEVRIVKILEEYGIEIANPSLAKPANTSYVVISRETERFVNEIPWMGESTEFGMSICSSKTRILLIGIRG